MKLGLHNIPAALRQIPLDRTFTAAEMRGSPSGPTLKKLANMGLVRKAGRCGPLGRNIIWKVTDATKRLLGGLESI